MAVADEQKLPAWRLFKISYCVGIREMFFYDKDQVALYGRPTTGNKQIDQAMMGNYRTVMIPVCTDDTRGIRGMDYYFSLGADILFHNLDDVPLIYRDIVEHLQDWENYIHNNLNGRAEAPIDELITLDELKNCMFLLTQKADDPLAPARDKSMLRRTFTRKRSMFNDEYHQQEDTLKEEYSLDGSHIFRPGTMDDTPTVAASPAKQASDIREHMKKLPDKGTKNFTTFFEKYKIEQQDKEGGRQWDD